MNEIIVVTGQRGCGKTTFVKSVIENFDKVIIFDLMGEFIYLESSNCLQELFAKLELSHSNAFFHFSYYNPKSTEKDFIKICKAINRLRDIAFVVDEVDYFSSAHYIPESLAEIVKRGRHQNISLVVATRRPHEIPRIITSQVTKFITFRHVEPRDLAYVKDLTGIEDSDVKMLKNFEYLEWCVRSGSVTKKHVTKQGG